MKYWRLLSLAAVFAISAIAFGCGSTTAADISTEEFITQAEFVPESQDICDNPKAYAGKKIKTLLEVDSIDNNVILAKTSETGKMVKIKGASSQEPVEKGNLLRVYGIVRLDAGTSVIEARTVKIPKWGKVQDKFLARKSKLKGKNS